MAIVGLIDKISKLAGNNKAYDTPIKLEEPLPFEGRAI